MRSALLAACAIALAAAPATAEAGSVQTTDTVERICEFGDCYVEQANVLRFEARAGESNDLRMSVTGTRVLFEDGAAPLTVGRGCTRIDAQRASCRIAPRRTAHVYSVTAIAALGDGADRALLVANALPQVEARLDGDAGDDTLAANAAATLDGGDGADTVTGSRFADRLHGGNGSDTLRGEAGDDVLRGDEPFGDELAPDVLDGGTGRDRADYGHSDTPIDLSQHTGPGGDTLTLIEGLLASAPALTGDDGDNVLEGSGDLIGSAGDDLLVGGSFADGGPGDDLLVPDKPTKFSCGPGIDTVEFAREVLSAIPDECERGTLWRQLDIPLRAPRRTASALSLLVLPVPGGVRPVSFSLNAGDWAGPEIVRLTVTRNGTVLATGKTRVRVPRRQGARAVLRAPLTAAGRRAGAGTVRVTVRAFNQRLTFPVRLPAG